MKLARASAALLLPLLVVVLATFAAACGDDDGCGDGNKCPATVDGGSAG